MTEILAHLVQLPAQVVVVVAPIHVIQAHLAAAVEEAVQEVVAAMVLQDKVILVARGMVVQDTVEEEAQVPLVNLQLLQNQILTALEALAYFRTWAGLVHFILVAVALDQQILEQADMEIQPPAVEQQQELAVVGGQIQHPLETALLEQLIVAAQAVVPQLEMVRIKELAEQAAPG
jgi:hypothetical protein